MKRSPYQWFMALLAPLVMLLFVHLHPFPAGAAETIVAAVPPDFPPTYFRDPHTGKATGFAVDIMNEVARRANLNVDYVFGQNWAELTDMVERGKADVIPSLTIDDDRKKKFLFTRTVETTPSAILCAASPI
jgi:ABC-type amino acid transport substrate-binding protein